MCLCVCIFRLPMPGPGTLVLSDALNHTSIVAGVKASGAIVKVFRHNDMAHLEKLLRFHIAEGQPRTHRPWKKVSSSGLRSMTQSRLWQHATVHTSS